MGNYLLEKTTTENVIAEAHAEVIRLVQLHNKTQIEYTELFGARTLGCNRMYHNYVLKGIFIEELQDSIR